MTRTNLKLRSFSGRSKGNRTEGYYIVEGVRYTGLCASYGGRWARETAMLRDDGSDGGGRRRSARNVLGEPLEVLQAMAEAQLSHFLQEKLGNV
jgi:hypothetical protein